jgi:acetyl-CoA carboxylase biotin carboxylase subunit
MEMNTRIQVEHCITEEAYGVDLVKEQIKIAAGEALSHWMRNVQLKYHAIECRVNAEDPFNGFQPSPGKIELYYAPGGRGVRIDSHAYTGYVVPPYYDSMIAKLVVWDVDRPAAIERAVRALTETVIEGVPSTRELAIAVLRTGEFASGAYSTSTLASNNLLLAQSGPS